MMPLMPPVGSMVQVAAATMAVMFVAAIARREFRRTQGGEQGVLA